jgi:Icc-related predicted phosphoesterase
MKILCITDIHGNNKKLSPVLEKENDSTLIILGGDITHLGGYKQAAKILKPALESNIKILAVHGNIDRKGVLEYLEEKGLSIHGRCVCENDVLFLGLGGSNPTPHFTPQEYSDEDARQILKNALNGITRDKKTVFVSHAPPINTTLDFFSGGKHVGSRVTREVITTYQIDLCICGHIHESAGIDKIGKGICVNPGLFRDGYYAIATITDTNINVVRRYI